MKRLIIINLGIFSILTILLEISLRYIYSDRGYFRRVFPDDDEYTTETIVEDQNWIKNDPELGWVCQNKEKLRFNIPAYFDTRYVINDQGFRSTFNFNSQDTSNCKKIMLVGDSFLFGMYLEEDQTIVHKLGKKLGPKFKLYNISVPGWGIDQMYLAYLKYLDIINPDLVVVCYIDDDMIRTLHAKRSIGSKPRLKIDGDSLSLDTSISNPIERFFWTNQISNQLYTRYMQWYSVKLTKAIFQQLIENEKDNERTPLFVHMPLEEHILTGDNQILFDLEDFITALSADYYDFRNAFLEVPADVVSRSYRKNDGHLTAFGSELLANNIFTMINNSVEINTNQRISK